MKLADITIGSEYAALDSPQSNGRSDATPGHVRVLEIVKTEKRVRGYGYGSSSKMRTVNKVSVEVLDDGNRTGYGPISRAKKGDTLTIETRQLVIPWTDELASSIQEKLDTEVRREEYREDIMQRLEALLPPDDGTSYTRAFSVRVGKTPNTDGDFPVVADLRDGYFIKLLELAEKGGAHDA
jgi:hypothetical protein